MLKKRYSKYYMNNKKLTIKLKIIIIINLFILESNILKDIKARNKFYQYMIYLDK